MTRCSRAQRSVASVWGEKCKQVVSGVRGVCDDVTCPILPSGEVQVLKAGQVHTNDPFCCPYSPLQSSYIWFAGWPKPDSYRAAQNRLNNSGVKLSYAPVAGWTFSVDQGSTISAESMWASHFRHQGTWMTPLQLQCCSWWWVGGEQGGFSWSPRSSPQFWACWAPGCCDCTDSQLLLVSVLDEADQCGVICKLQEFDRGVFRGAVIRVEREEQWRENAALRSSSTDRTSAGCEFSHPH